MKQVALALTAILLLQSAAFAQDSAIATLKSINKSEASETRKAQAALKELAGTDAAGMRSILMAFQGTKPVAANWLRAAFETAAARKLAAGKLPDFTAFITDKKQNSQARRLAYEWMLKQDDSLADKLIPKMLLDPAPEFRRDAIRRLIDSANGALEAGDTVVAKKTFEKALTAAVHDDQVQLIVKPLKELGREVDVQQHFGFLPGWSIVGPFNNKEGVGFAEVYAPEKKVDLTASLDGEDGTVEWASYSTDDKYGTMNIAKQIKNHKGSCMYATTEFTSARDQAVEFRLTTPNAWKLWVNGKYVFGREEYHRTPSSLVMDLYRVPVKLKAGKNRILLKVCQNEQEQDWAQRYEFRLRVCDETGSAVRSSGK